MMEPRFYIIEVNDTEHPDLPTDYVVMDRANGWDFSRTTDKHRAELVAARLNTEGPGPEYDAIYPVGSRTNG